MKDNVKELNELRIKLDLLDIPYFYHTKYNILTFSNPMWRIQVGDIYYEVNKGNKKRIYHKDHYSCDQFLKELMQAGNYYDG